MIDNDRVLFPRINQKLNPLEKIWELLDRIEYIKDLVKSKQYYGKVLNRLTMKKCNYQWKVIDILSSIGNKYWLNPKIVYIDSDPVFNFLEPIEGDDLFVDLTNKIIEGEIKNVS